MTIPLITGNFSASQADINNLVNQVNTALNSMSQFEDLTGDVTSVGPVTTLEKVQGNTVSGTTGTGNVVFSNSPVFTTPDIGSATGSISGNSATATALETARTINGVSFNGTADISIPVGSSTFAALTDVIVDIDHNMLAVNAVPSISGNQNTGFGQPVFASLTSGSTNSAFGAYSLQLITSGSGNSAFGQASLNQMVNGSENTGLGHNAGYAIVDGTNNVCIGSNANVDSASATNRIVIGYSATGTTNNTVQLGNSSITDVYFGNPATTVLHAGSLADGVTATTQSQADNSTKVATTAYVDISNLLQIVSNISGITGASAITNAVAISAADYAMITPNASTLYFING